MSNDELTRADLERFGGSHPHDAAYIYRSIFGSKMSGHRQVWPDIHLGELKRINPDMLSRFLNTCTPPPGDKRYECVWLPLCGGACPQLRLFGKHKCPPYRNDPDAFVLAKYAHMIEENALSGIRG